MLFGLLFFIICMLIPVTKHHVIFIVPVSCITVQIFQKLKVQLYKLNKLLQCLLLKKNVILKVTSYLFLKFSYLISLRCLL